MPLTTILATIVALQGECNIPVPIVTEESDWD